MDTEQTQPSRQRSRAIYWSNAAELYLKRTVESSAGFFTPHLQPTMRLLDCGCGPGTISVGLAQRLSAGELIGIDNNARHVAMAQASAATAEVTNAAFEEADVYQLPYDDASFDAIFSHALLEHLERPVEALVEMRRVLKPQGVIGIRIPEATGHIVWPEGAAYEELQAFAPKIHESHGGSVYRGKQLHALLQSADFVDTRMSASYDSMGTPEEVQAWTANIVERFQDPRFIARMEEHGATTREALARHVTTMQEWAQQPDAFYASAWCEVIGWRP